MYDVRLGLEIRLLEVSSITGCFYRMLGRFDRKNRLYGQLLDTDIGKRRMRYVYVLRATHDQASQARSRELYEGIKNELNDEDFRSWFHAIDLSLSRSSNENGGKHQEVLDKISKILGDSKNTATMSCQVSQYIIEARPSRWLYSYKLNKTTALFKLIWLAGVDIWQLVRLYT